MKSLSRRLGEMADLVLENLLMKDIILDQQDQWRAEAGQAIRDDLWSSDFYLIDSLCSDLDGGGRYREFLLHDPGEQEFAVWPIDQALVTIRYDAITYIRIASLKPSDLRGLSTIVPQKSVALLTGKITSAGKFAGRDILGYVGGKWIMLDKEIKKGDMMYTKEDIAGSRSAAIELALGIALTERYNWHAAFSYNDSGPRLVVPTNPTGCLELFRSRDKAPGAQRRSALRHWVNSHYRNQNDDMYALSYVREHLRGHTSFIWNSLLCELMVSQYDLEKNDFFRIQANEWRAQRKHNRIRLRRKM